ncbi:class I SAM-dependent methyltransferase [Xanthomonas tesorieronis]|uniref:class I SAM-dependent methyltransferase n=1 Tax=Xanthomonas tesorieronis TaxID=3160839 RepID=UPI003516A57B
MDDSSELFQQAYYDGNGQNGDRPALRLFTRLALRYIPSGSVLDFGCGPGFLLNHLRRHFKVAGVEASDWARAEAARRTGAPIHASIGEIGDASLSGIVSIHVVEHIEDAPLEEILAEWFRVLRPGGRALVVTPDAGGVAARRKGADWIALTDPTHINLKTHRQWREVFKRAGFFCVAEAADGLWDFPYILKRLGRAEVFLLGWPTLFQFVFARLVLPPGSGESTILVLQKPL